MCISIHFDIILRGFIRKFGGFPHSFLVQFVVFPTFFEYSSSDTATFFSVSFCDMFLKHFCVFLPFFRMNFSFDVSNIFSV